MSDVYTCNRWQQLTCGDLRLKHSSLLIAYQATIRSCNSAECDVYHCNKQLLLLLAHTRNQLDADVANCGNVHVGSRLTAVYLTHTRLYHKLC
jgi:hypothetical protein